MLAKVGFPLNCYHHTLCKGGMDLSQLIHFTATVFESVLESANSSSESADSSTDFMAVS